METVEGVLISNPCLSIKIFPLFLSVHGRRSETLPTSCPGCHEERAHSQNTWSSTGPLTTVEEQDPKEEDNFHSSNLAHRWLR